MFVAYPQKDNARCRSLEPALRLHNTGVITVISARHILGYLLFKIRADGLEVLVVNGCMHKSYRCKDNANMEISSRTFSTKTSASVIIFA